MADLQPLLPRKISQSVFPPIDDGAAPPIAQAAMGGGLQSLLPPTQAPTVIGDPRQASDSTDPLLQRKSALDADLYRRTNPIAPTTTLGKIGHVASRIGNVLGDIFAPATMALIPGTDLHNERIMARDKSDLQDVSQEETAQGTRKQQAAQTAYTEQRPAIEQSKILQKLTSTLAPKGIKATMNPDGTIDTEDDTESQAYKDRVSLASMHDATAEKEAIQSDIAKNHYVPGTPEYAEAQRKLAQVDTRLHTALAGLGIRAENLGLRKEITAASLYGTDLSGNALPGAPIINGPNGPTVVGQKNAGHAITQQGAVGAFNDLGGSVDHTEKALRDFYAEGGSLSDPRMAAALSDPESVSGDVIHGWVQSGLSPRAVAALTAVKQLHEQAGILRSATKGTASEKGAQRILDTVPTAGDSNDVAISKLGEVRNVQGRLAPGMTPVAGGQKVTAGTPTQGEHYERVNGKLVKVNK